jgi:hypothetical protein
MTDLEQDIHDYVHAAFQSVSIPVDETEVGAAQVVEAALVPRRHTHAKSKLTLIAAAVVLVTAMVLGFALLRSSPTEPTIAPTRQLAMQALTATGPADCSSVTKTGDTTLLAVTVNGGHAICVTQNGNSTAAYFDGKPGGSTSGLTPLGEGTWSMGGLATAKGRFYDLANLLNNAGSLRLTFCNGKTLDLHPLNSTNPRFVAARYDLRKLGHPSPQQLDTTGRPIGDAHPPSPPRRSGSCTPTTS